MARQSTEANKGLCCWTPRFIQMTSSRLKISPCHKTTTLVLIPLYNLSFHLWKPSKNAWAIPYFCRRCLLWDACRCMEMHVDVSMELHGDARRRKVDWKIVAFLSSVVYYFGDLLKSANMAFVRHKTFISLYFNCLSSLPLILGDFKATHCVLVDIITSSSVRQPQLLRTRNFALSLERKYQ